MSRNILFSNSNNSVFHDVWKRRGWSTHVLVTKGDFGSWLDHEINGRALVIVVDSHRPAMNPVMSDETWSHTLKNVGQQLYTYLKVGVETLAQCNGGNIILVMSADVMYGTAALSHKSSAQSMLWAYGRHYARQYGHKHIRINAVLAGYIHNSYLDSAPDYVQDKHVKEIPLRRFGTESELAEVVCFLCGTESSYISGQTLLVDGGVGDQGTLCWRLLDTGSRGLYD